MASIHYIMPIRIDVTITSNNGFRDNWAGLSSNNSNQQTQDKLTQLTVTFLARLLPSAPHKTPKTLLQTGLICLATITVEEDRL